MPSHLAADDSPLASTQDSAPAFFPISPLFHTIVSFWLEKWTAVRIKAQELSLGELPDHSVFLSPPVTPGLVTALGIL